MILRYNIDKEIVVKDYLEEVGISRHLRKQVRGLDNIYINGEKGKNWFTLKPGDVLELVFEEELNQEILEDDGDLDIVYEDEYIIVINKPNDLTSMPSVKHPKDNVLSRLKGYFIRNNVSANMHLVNRLDYQTSGLLVVAKSGIIHYELSKQKIVKKYLCIIDGCLDDKSGLIDLPISRYKAPEIRRYVDKESGKIALTKYKVLKEFDDKSLVEVELLTGRTHQIRVHFSYLHHPLIGDKLYGVDNGGKLMLHAYYLSFIHPITNKKIELINNPNWLN